ncbi:1329_t:CDS:2, partial [Entrophospora sp. SA101]
ELINIIQEEWGKISIETLHCLILSLPDHVKAVIKAKGGHNYVETIHFNYNFFSLDAFESEYNPIQQNDCGEMEWFGDYIIPIFKGALKLNTSCRVPCSPHKYDLTKWNSDPYQLPRMLKDMLGDMLKRFRSRNKCTSNLYTIGIQQYMTEIRVYMMEKRDIYRLHHLKSFNLPLSYSSYGNLRLALSWAWDIKQYMTEIRVYMMEKRDIYRLHHLKSFNLPLSYSSYGNLRLALSWAWDIKCLVENLSFEFYDETFVTSTTPKRDPPDEMKTDTTPERSRKKKFDKFDKGLLLMNTTQILYILR